jgi:hypothetical protein
MPPRAAKIICVYVPVALLLVILFFPGLPDVQRAAELSKCRSNLRQIWQSLQNYVSVNTRLPTDERGDLSLSVLRDSTQIEFEAACPTASRHATPEPRYVINPHFQASDLLNATHGSGKVVLIDACGNHFTSAHGGEMAVHILFANGSVRTWKGSSEECKSLHHDILQHGELPKTSFIR